MGTLFQRVISTSGSVQTNTWAPLVYACLSRFGAPLQDLTVDDLSTPGMVFQIGVPLVRIDILTKIDGFIFEDAWSNCTIIECDGLKIPIIGLTDLIKNKRSTGRTKELADAEQLEENLGEQRRPSLAKRCI